MEQYFIQKYKFRQCFKIGRKRYMKNKTKKQNIPLHESQVFLMFLACEILENKFTNIYFFFEQLLSLNVPALLLFTYVAELFERDYSSYKSQY